MGQFHKIRCPTCGASVQVLTAEEIPDRCPACKVWFGDALRRSGDGTGLNTGTARGEGLKPLSDLEQDVY